MPDKMASRVFILMTAAIVAFSPIVLRGQGANDPGLGTMGGLGPWEDGTDMPTSIVISEIAGLDKQRSIHLTTEFEFNWNIWTWLGLQARLPYVYVNGEFGTFHGLGDLSLLLTHTLVDNDRIFLKLHIGAKLPTNDADLTLYGLSVPMSFQTSLGTYQLIAGLVFHSKGWLAGAGYQRSYGPNNNRFRHSDWPNEPLVWDYPESPFLERSDDIAFRFQKNFRQGRSRFFLGLLPLYHLHRDKIKEDGVEAMVEGSDGLTLNIQAGWTIDFAKAGFIRLMTGFPVIAKSVDTDGLGRSVAIQGGIGCRFP